MSTKKWLEDEGLRALEIFRFFGGRGSSALFSPIPFSSEELGRVMFRLLLFPSVVRDGEEDPLSAFQRGWKKAENEWEAVKAAETVAGRTAGDRKGKISVRRVRSGKYRR